LYFQLLFWSGKGLAFEGIFWQKCFPDGIVGFSTGGGSARPAFDDPYHFSVMKKKSLEKLHKMLPRTMGRERFGLRRRLWQLQRSGQMTADKLAREIEALEISVRASMARRQDRILKKPVVTTNETLPITACKKDIIQAIAAHPVVIIAGETGSGKTTQIPKYCLAAGRGIDGFIGCTQPRRITATMVARRIAAELDVPLGESVGYKIRFRDRSRPESYIKIMTDGILLAEAQSDRYLDQYDTIIVDEAHERSLNIDFVLGILKTLLTRRNDLKLIITSATIDTRKFSDAFGNAPVIEVSGRMFPVEVSYLADGQIDANTDNGDLTHVEQAVQAVNTLDREKARGDILIFMPTEQDIRETCELLAGRSYPGTTILPLYARLSAADQARVYARPAGRKIIVSTNVAETSLTIPGIKYVIDTGLARIPRYNPRSRTTAMPVVAISRSSADQRMGRCGRVENGVCIRLYTQEDYQARPLYTPPEILRSNLAEVVLRMISLRLGDVADFPFVDKPAPRSIQDGFEVLKELGAIAEKKDRRKAGNSARQHLTATGQLMARIPLDPRLARILIEAHRRGCLSELSVIAAALSIQDPRERPAEKAAAADAMHAPFQDRDSDFLTLLNIWNQYQDKWKKVKSQNQMKKYCKAHFLSYRRMREWRDIHQQIDEILRENGLSCAQRSFADEHERFAAVHQAISCGFLSSIAVKKDKNLFKAAKGREAMIFPGSALFNRAGDWIVAAEMVETSRLFARMAARIQPEWLETLGGALCRRTYSNPHWERNREQVVAAEQVSLFGLVIVTERKVAYGRINPQEAGDIFIRSALVAGDLKQPPGFVTFNLSRIDDIRDMEDRIRRRDLLVGEDALTRFYSDRLGIVYDMQTLRKRLKEKGGDAFLKMTAEDLLHYHPAEDLGSQYPGGLQLGNDTFKCSYTFDPGGPADGVSLHIPAAAAAGVPADETDWLVPGLLKEKITALIKGLPKKYRKHLVPIAGTVDELLAHLPQPRGRLITTLGRMLRKRFGVDIPASAWDPDALPDHLKMRISITGPDGKEIRSARDKTILSRDAAILPDDSLLADVKQRWEKTGITGWDFGDLPESVDVKCKGVVRWTVYPGLQVAEQAGRRIDLKLFNRRGRSVSAHREGVAGLYMLKFAKDLKYLRKNLTLTGPGLQATRYFGGSQKFESILYDAVVEKLFKKNIRTKTDFDTHANIAGPQILPCGRSFIESATPILEAARVTGNILATLENANSGNAALIKYFRRLRKQISGIAPPHFIKLYDSERINHLPRYIRAIAIRAERAAANFDKDRQKAQEVKRFSAALDAMLKNLSASVSDDKRRAVEEFFWLIEEYKVSLFAQEFKTALPVSKNRLAEKMSEIERMA